MIDPPSPGSPTETFAAPAEVRHFTDGSFPAGFVLQLFSHTQLRASDSKDSPKEGRVAEGGLLQPESPSPGELVRGADKCGVRKAASLGSGLHEAAWLVLQSPGRGAEGRWI